tara:strand:- start:42 stop:461 length:420 start_codon:yes stop_codon:yes gene_type:complete
MPSDTLDIFRSGIPGFVTEWTLTDTSDDDDDEVACSKPAEAGMTHFITHLCVSSDSTTSSEGGSVKATLSGGSSGLWLEFWQAGAGGFFSNGAPAGLEFSAPIQFGENESVVFTSELIDANNDQVTFTMSGFTSSVRIS